MREKHKNLKDLLCTIGGPIEEPDDPLEIYTRRKVMDFGNPSPKLCSRIVTIDVHWQRICILQFHPFWGTTCRLAHSALFSWKTSSVLFLAQNTKSLERKLIGAFRKHCVIICLSQCIWRVSTSASGYGQATERLRTCKWPLSTFLPQVIRHLHFHQIFRDLAPTLK